MARKGGGFGFVMLLVVLAVVALLAARAWERAGPTAVAAAAPATPEQAEGAAAREALRDLPGLDAAREAAGTHAREVGQALESGREEENP